ncbi:hypothetical protein DFH07DRAFT_309325 [Mycena maculata]|uniref:Uncharacterized protein n=1 Tax=Mycena maculata TaxID=230809 RepID=A0AAD7MK40_9AGAR|nr:hypothetical protein DFH07DRAFT_309325 [Mycena maculata]
MRVCHPYGMRRPSALTRVVQGLGSWTGGGDGGRVRITGPRAPGWAFGGARTKTVGGARAALFFVSRALVLAALSVFVHQVLPFWGMLLWSERRRRARPRYRRSAWTYRPIDVLVPSRSRAGYDSGWCVESQFAPVLGLWLARMLQVVTPERHRMGCGRYRVWGCRLCSGRPFKSDARKSCSSPNPSKPPEQTAAAK